MKACKPTRCLVVAAKPDEDDVLERWRCHCRAEAISVLRMLSPGPADDRFVRVPRVQISKRLPVAVPQLLSTNDPPQGSTNHLDHHRSTREVQPHHRVRPLPHRSVDHDRSIIAVDHPGVRRRDGRHPGQELIRIDRFPVVQMVNRVELDVRDAKARSDLPREARLARTCVADNRYPLHTTIFADGVRPSRCRYVRSGADLRR